MHQFTDSLKPRVSLSPRRDAQLDALKPVAFAVLLRALKDYCRDVVPQTPDTATSSYISKDAEASARRFFDEDSEDLVYWCEIAGVTQDAVRGLFERYTLEELHGLLNQKLIKYKHFNQGRKAA